MAMFNTQVHDTAAIKVIGIGKSGIRAVAAMPEADRAVKRSGIEYVAIGTDAHGPDLAGTDRIVSIENLFGEIPGAPTPGDDGFDPGEGTREKVRRFIGNADMTILVLALGCRASAEATLLAAQASRDAGALTVVIASRPLPFEGKKRIDEAVRCIDTLLEAADSVIVFSPEKLSTGKGEDHLPLADLQKRIDETCYACVRGVTDPIILPGLICTDFADVKTVLEGAGLTYFGKGTGRGDNRWVEAVTNAMNSPLFEGDLSKARSIVFSVAGGRDLQISEINQAASMLVTAVDENASIIASNVLTESDEKAVSVTIIAGNCR